MATFRVLVHADSSQIHRDIHRELTISTSKDQATQRRTPSWRQENHKKETLGHAHDSSWLPVKTSQQSLCYCVDHIFIHEKAALQFEWAWQHPHKSRHFRENGAQIFGRRGTKCLNKLIEIVRTMITRHPYNTWPLHIKLFTQPVVDLWESGSGANGPSGMPPGFTCSVELEGVDGKSGHPGSGRKGPIATDDAEFSSGYLAKHIALLATERHLQCVCCHQSLHNYASEPLQTVLCPSSCCTAVSHLSCLSKYFLESADHSRQTTSDIIPRGGHCPSCGNYTLWGDVIRGSYRRFGAVNKGEPRSDEGSPASEVGENGDLTGEEIARPLKPKTKKSPVAVSSRKKASKRTTNRKTCAHSSNLESSAVVRKRGRPRKQVDGDTPIARRTSGKSKKSMDTPRVSRRLTGSSKCTSRKTIDSTVTSPTPECYHVHAPLKRKRGRPRKVPPS